MSEKKESPKQEQASLELANLVSSGKTVKEAKEIIAKREAAKKEAVTETNEEPAKLSAEDKKKLIAEEIEKLGGEVPKSGSVAIFEQALEAAKEAAENNDEGDDEDPDDVM